MEAPTPQGHENGSNFIFMYKFLTMWGEAPTTQGQKVAPYLKYNKVKILIVPFEWRMMSDD